jgi:hypothetical protein
LILLTVRRFNASAMSWVPAIAIVVAWLTPAAAPARTEDPASAEADAPAVETAPRPLRRVLTRPVLFSARHLDHGVLGVGLAGGWPHLYRLELGLGILDHLTIGATAHWLPSQPAPRWSPKVAVAFWRGSSFEAGAHYFQSLIPPPPAVADPRTPRFQRSVHWVLATASISQRFITAGFDIGAARSLDPDPSVMVPEGEPATVARARWLFAGGLHLRAGTRRWGFTANMLAPRLYAELAFDVRFGVFEQRPRGGWKDPEVVYSTDRRVPRR